MSEAIYYFTGTKSSYSAALRLAENIGYSEVINVVEAPLGIRQESIGLVFPVYSYDVPGAIKEFVKRSDFSKVSYIYALCTSAGDAGNVFYHLNKLLLKKGRTLDYAAELKLGDNSLVITTDDGVLKKRASGAGDIIKKVSADVKSRITSRKSYSYSALKAVMGSVTNYALSLYYRIDQKSADASRCNKCGKCVNTCSAKNITEKNGLITFGGECYDCFGCINVCPRKAIRFGKISPDKYKQYKLPEFGTRKDI